MECPVLTRPPLQSRRRLRPDVRCASPVAAGLTPCSRDESHDIGASNRREYDANLPRLIARFGTSPVTVLVDPDDFRVVYVVDGDENVELTNIHTDETTIAYSFNEAKAMVTEAKSRLKPSEDAARFWRTLFRRSTQSAPPASKAKSPFETSKQTAKAARAHPSKAMVQEGISQHLRNQRPDEIPNLFAYTQLLLSISQTEGRYGTTHTAAKFWAKWREEEFDDAHLQTVKNAPLKPEVRQALFEGKPAALGTYFDTLWRAPMQASEQDRLLVSLLTPARLMEFLRGFVLFDRKVGKIVARYQ